MQGVPGHRREHSDQVGTWGFFVGAQRSQGHLDSRGLTANGGGVCLVRASHRQPRSPWAFPEAHSHQSDSVPSLEVCLPFFSSADEETEAQGAQGEDADSWGSHLPQALLLCCSGFLHWDPQGRKLCFSDLCIRAGSIAGPPLASRGQFLLSSWVTRKGL